MKFNLENYKKIVSMLNATKEDGSMALEILKHIYGKDSAGHLTYNDDVAVAHQLIIKLLNKAYEYKRLCALPYQFKVVGMDDLYSLIEGEESVQSENTEDYKLIYSYALSKMLTEEFSDFKNIKINIEYKWD
jgi:hypothetical protein